ASGVFLPYFTGGLAVGDINASLPLPVLPGGSISNAGWTVGAGLEVGLVSNVSLKAEYLYVDLGNFNCGLNCGLPPGGNVSFTTSVFRGGGHPRRFRLSRAAHEQAPDRWPGAFR